MTLQEHQCNYLFVKNKQQKAIANQKCGGFFILYNVVLEHSFSSKNIIFVP